jgi:L-asparagine oxygenase
MTETDLAVAVKAALDQWQHLTSSEERVAALASPATLSATMGLAVQAELQRQGYALADVLANVLKAPCCHLRGVFDASVLVETPLNFSPLPDTPSTVMGRAAALAIHGLLRLETVSYGSENDGNLFVNLVAMPGEGAVSEKSKARMRGHTDAVSFPFNGEDDPEEPRIAPSPDFVTLIGLRNPEAIPTRVMSLDDLLNRLPADDVDELKKAQFLIRAQRTFRRGTKKLLGEEHAVIDAPVLKDTARGTYVRYSHSNVIPTEEDGAAARASARLEAACNESAVPVVINPGDVVLVNNRLALHGRAEVGDEVGGQSRWLLRTYALDTSDMPSYKRHLSGRPPHVLYP